MTRFDPVSVIPFFVLTIVILGVVYANISRTRFLNQTIAQASSQPRHTFEPASTPNPTSEPTPSPTEFPLSSPGPQSSAPTNQSIILSYRYPGSTILTQNPSHLELKSSESPNKITEWYKSKIKSLGLTTHSMSSTSTNDNILNVMAAAGNNSQVKIEIKKQSEEQNTVIKVDL